MDFRSEKFNLIIIFFVAQKYTTISLTLSIYVDLVGIEYLNLVNKYMYILFIISFNYLIYRKV